MKKPKILPLKEPRLPKSTRGIQIHKDVNDYNRNLEKKEVEQELENSESECVSDRLLDNSRQ